MSIACFVVQFGIKSRSEWLLIAWGETECNYAIQSVLKTMLLIIHTTYIAIDVLYILCTKMAAKDIRIRLRSCDLYSMKGITLGRPPQLCTYLDGKNVVILNINNIKYYE